MAVLKLSGYRMWPEAGGSNDQPQALIDDIARYLRLEQALKEGRVFLHRYEAVSKSTPKLASPFARKE